MKYQHAATGEMRDNYPHRFGPAELDHLDRLLEQADAVVPLRELPGGDRGARVVGMRHDVDHNLEHAIKLAEWEHVRGYRSTYFLLHDAWYWNDYDQLAAGARMLEDLGHEVGLHSNAVVRACLRVKPRARWYSPAKTLSDHVQKQIRTIIATALHDLRDTGATVTGIAAHGDIGCYEMGIVNDLRHTNLTLEEFRLDYDADTLRRGRRELNDNHGTWASPPELASDRNTLILIHPCHWDIDAVRQRAAA